MSLVFIPDRQLIPEVGTKVCFPGMRDIGISYCRLLLHDTRENVIFSDDTMLRDDSYRTGTSDTPVCECGPYRESAEHFLLRCNTFQEARNRLKDTIMEISDSSACKKRCLSEVLCWHRSVMMLQVRKESS